MQLQVEVSERDHARGEQDARVTLMHYGDFECPFSGAAHPVLKEMERRLGPALRLVFRPFPLDDIHPHALAAALAAEAAARQNRFWEMHDHLFENQQRLEDDDIQSHARALGLDAAKFQSDLSSAEVENVVRESVRGGKASGVHGTPTFWINGVFHDNHERLWKPDRLLAAINEALE